MFMRNDNRNEPFPLIRRTGVTIAACTVVSLATLGIAVSNITGNLFTLADLKKGVVRSPIPLPQDHIDALAETWQGNVVVHNAGYATVTANVADTDLVTTFAAVEWANLALTLLLSAIILLGALAMFAGRLRWNHLATLVITGGAIAAIGSNLIQTVYATAGENLSMWLYINDSVWWEPGFLAGINFAPLAIGTIIVGLGLTIRSAARLAKEADGVF